MKWNDPKLELADSKVFEILDETPYAHQWSQVHLSGDVTLDIDARGLTLTQLRRVIAVLEGVR